MASAPFRIAPTRPVTVRVALEPVYNVLMSMSLLHVAERLADVDPWVLQTAAELTPAQLQTNRLIFEGLGEALILTPHPPDFPSYLDLLAQQPATALRDHILERLIHATGEATPERLLHDVEVFLAQVARAYPADPVDEQLQRTVHSLLNDPAALHRTLIEHLTLLWTTALSKNWQRNSNYLERMVETLQRRKWPDDTAATAIAAFLNRDVPPAIAGQLDGVREVIFVLSPHVGPLASRFDSATTIWVFVRGRIEDLPIRTVPIKRVEVLRPLSALADDTRLRILELLAQQDGLRSQEIIERVALSQSNTSRHLKQLVAAGLVIEQKDEGANKSYLLNPARVAWLGRALNELLSRKPDPNLRAEARAEQPADLRRFLDTDWRVVFWPSKQHDQQLVREYLAAKFEVGRVYTEREVNTILAEWDTSLDPSTLRRDLCDSHLLERTRDGARYWRVAEGTTET